MLAKVDLDADYTATHFGDQIRERALPFRRSRGTRGTTAASNHNGAHNHDGCDPCVARNSPHTT